MNKAKPKWKMLQWMLLVIMVILLASCSRGGLFGDASSTALSGGSKDTGTGGVRKVVWWHSMGGDAGKVVDKLVADFNTAHPDIQVEAVYQGSYYESLTKFKALKDTSVGPSMIQIYDIGARYAIDSGEMTPIQQLIDEEHYDLSQLEEAVLARFTVDGKLYSMPFNTSNPLLYYNKDLFKAAGLDAEHPPVTFEEVTRTAMQLSRGSVTGASFPVYGWFVEQFLANQGAELVDHGNGRDSAATAIKIQEEPGVRTLLWWKDLIDRKAAVNPGRSMGEPRKAFAAGQVAMILDTSASLHDLIVATQGKFELGTGPLPRPSGSSDGGTVVGGASNWILNKKSKEEQQAAWTFMKYLAEPGPQAYFHLSTGYFPIHKSAYQERSVMDNLAQHPQYKTAADQLHAAKRNRATDGAVFGVYPEAREIIEFAADEALAGRKTPKAALEAAAKDINARMAAYQESAK